MRKITILSLLSFMPLGCDEQMAIMQQRSFKDPPMNEGTMEPSGLLPKCEDLPKDVDIPCRVSKLRVIPPECVGNGC